MAPAEANDFCLGGGGRGGQSAGKGGRATQFNVYKEVYEFNEFN